MSAGAPPAGWYPDPWQAGNQRWWDGTTWTGYAAAPGPSGPLRLDEEERYAARARVALLAVIPLALVGQAALVSIVRLFVDRANDNSFANGSGLGSGLYARELLAQVGGIGNMVAGILFLLWFHRACADARALGLSQRRDPSLATASFVIPVVSLWWPYQSTCDLLPPDDPARAHVLRWWLLWIVGGGVATFVVVVGALVSTTLGWVLLVVPAVQLVAAALAARQVVADVGAAHRSLAGAAGRSPAR